MSTDPVIPGQVHFTRDSKKIFLDSAEGRLGPFGSIDIYEAQDSAEAKLYSEANPNVLVFVAYPD